MPIRQARPMVQINRPKSHWEIEQEERERRNSMIVAGCAIMLFAFLVGFVCGWVSNAF